MGLRLDRAQVPSLAAPGVWGGLGEQLLCPRPPGGGREGGRPSQLSSTAPPHSQQPVPEQLRIQVSRVSMHDYEALHYDKEQLKEACEWPWGQGQGQEGRGTTKACRWAPG